jgi:hypothetical protein
MQVENEIRAEQAPFDIFKSGRIFSSEALKRLM